MATKAKKEIQLGIDETVIEDGELETALEAREAAKLDLGDVRKVYDSAHKRAMGEIEKQELPEGKVLRAGRFRIERKEVRPRAVRFETGASTRIYITPDGDE